MKVDILFRRSLAENGEFETCKKYFGSHLLESRIDCYGSVVIGRYSCLPYYKELEIDLEKNKSKLINSYKQHRWIASHEYYEYVQEFMPPTFTDYDISFANPQWDFIVKGKTNSKKTSWKTLYAPSRKDALVLAAELKTDPIIGPQDILYKKYVELENFGYDHNGIPISNEWRFFCLFNKVLTFGYYWSNFPEITPDPPKQAIELAENITKIVSDHVNFYVLDIAIKKNGEPILIEINDGQMSGLSNCSPDSLYTALKNETENIRRL